MEGQWEERFLLLQRVREGAKEGESEVNVIEQKKKPLESVVCVACGRVIPPRYWQDHKHLTRYPLCVFCYCKQTRERMCDDE